jgi:hypothetical protein
VEIRLCDLCLTGAGGECHTPGCALFLNRGPDLAIIPELYREVTWGLSADQALLAPPRRVGETELDWLRRCVLVENLGGRRG